MQKNNVALVTDVFGRPILTFQQDIPKGDIRIDVQDDAVNIFAGDTQISQIDDVPEGVAFWLSQQGQVPIMAYAEDDDLSASKITHMARVNADFEAEELADKHLSKYTKKLDSEISKIFHNTRLQEINEAEEKEKKRLMEEWLLQIQQEMKDNAKDEGTPAFRKLDKASKDPQDVAIFNYLGTVTPAAFLAEANKPIQVGQDMSGRIATVMPLSGNKKAEKSLSGFVKGFAEKHGATVVKMGKAIAARALILGAIGLVAPPLVPLAAVLYSGYKFKSIAPKILSTLDQQAKAHQKQGHGRLASLRKAVSNNKLAVFGLAVLGLATVASAVGIPTSLADTLEETLGLSDGTDAVVDGAEQDTNLETSPDNPDANEQGAGQTEEQAEEQTDPYADMSAQEIKDEAYKAFNGADGVEKNQALAVELYERAAEMGSEQAKTDLAYIQYHGLAGVEADPNAAVQTMQEMGRDRWLGGQVIPELYTEPVTSSSYIQNAAEHVSHDGGDTHVQTSGGQIPENAPEPIDFKTMPEYADIENLIGEVMFTADPQTGLVAELQHGNTTVPVHVYMNEHGFFEIDRITATPENPELIQRAGLQTLNMEQNANWDPNSGQQPYAPKITTQNPQAFFDKVDAPPADQDVSQSTADKSNPTRTNQRPISV